MNIRFKDHLKYYKFKGAALFLILSIHLLFSACQQDTKTLKFSKIVIDKNGPNILFPGGEHGFEQKISEYFKKSHHFTPKKPSALSLHIKIIQMGNLKRKPPSLSLLLQVYEADRLLYQSLAQAQSSQTMQELLNEALEAGTKTLIAEKKFEKMPAQEILSQLKNKDIDLWEYKASLLSLAQKKYPGLKAILLEFLKGGNQSIEATSLLALTWLQSKHKKDLSDLEINQALINYSLGKTQKEYILSIMLAQQLESAAPLSWLFTLSTGHHNATVRFAAQSVLDQIESHKD